LAGIVVANTIEGAERLRVAPVTGAMTMLLAADRARSSARPALSARG
jgi:hypothetical protein